MTTTKTFWLTNEERFDRMRADEENESIERFMALHAEELYEEAYEAWASDRRDDEEDDSREAYEDYLESLIPDYA